MSKRDPALQVKELQQKLIGLRADLIQKGEANRKTARYYLELVEEIPMGYPDGTGVLQPLDWIKWAKKELGYNKEDKDEE